MNAGGVEVERIFVYHDVTLMDMQGQCRDGGDEDDGIGFVGSWGLAPRGFGSLFSISTEGWMDRDVDESKLKKKNGSSNISRSINERERERGGRFVSWSPERHQSTPTCRVLHFPLEA